MARGLDFDRCHRLTHRWDELGGPPKGFEGITQSHRNSFWLRCDSCSMVKAYEVSMTTGQVVWARYWPQPGYYWEDSSQAAPLKADYRLDWLRSIMKQRGEQEASVAS